MADPRGVEWRDLAAVGPADAVRELLRPLPWIALAATMDEVAERYAEVMVNPDRAEAARALKPLNERQVFGKSIFLFDGVERARLAELGELHKPSVADLFVATMKGTYA